MKKTYPFLWMLHSSLNGVRLSKIQAGKAKASGMLWCPLTCFSLCRVALFFGLYIEMKSATGRIMPSQSRYLKRLLVILVIMLLCVIQQSEAIEKIKEYYL